MQEGSSQLTLLSNLNVDLHGQATMQSEISKQFTEEFHKEISDIHAEFDMLSKTHTIVLHDSLCMNSEHEMLMVVKRTNNAEVLERDPAPATKRTPS